MLPSLDQFKAVHGRLLMMMPGEKVTTSDEGFWQSSLSLFETSKEDVLVLQFCIAEAEKDSISTRLDLVFYQEDKVCWHTEISMASEGKSMNEILEVCKTRSLPVDAAVKASILVPAAIAIKRASVQIS
ncbi:hypothetical protein CL689_06180 [Candidatus Saccharibacteria bacterium]|nr:hypothetical protein [Candidatus Saccharibacteria bacterium]|tara:strand:- start:4908 stop:5294 length:387 start_codon:yes stop_codon:yes gene_type:complete